MLNASFFIVVVIVVVYSLENKKSSFCFDPSISQNSSFFPFVKTNLESVKLPNRQTLPVTGRTCEYEPMCFCF